METVVDDESVSELDSHPEEYDSDYYVDVTESVKSLKGPVQMMVTHQTMPNFKAGYLDCTPNQILDLHTAELLRMRPRTMAQELGIMLDGDYFSACSKLPHGIGHRLPTSVYQSCYPPVELSSAREVILLADHAFKHRLTCHLEDCPDRDPLYLRFPVVICRGPSFHLSEECVQTDVTVQVLAYWPRNITRFVVGPEKQLPLALSIDYMKVRIVCAPWIQNHSAEPLTQYWDIVCPKRQKYTYSNVFADGLLETWPNLEAVWLVAVDYKALRGSDGWRPQYTQIEFKAAGNLTPVSWTDVKVSHVHRSLHSCLFRVPRSSYDFVFGWCFIASTLLKKRLTPPIVLDIMLTVGFANALRWKSERNAFPYKTVTFYAMIVVLVSKGFGPWDIWQQMQVLPFSYCNQTYVKYLTK